MKLEYSWAGNIPLIGGMCLGAMDAFGKPPKFIASYSGFQNHDKNLMNWLNVTNKWNVPYYNLDKNYPEIKADVVVSTPPCAGLSMMNCSKCKSQTGSGASVNDWMYRSLRDNIDRLGAKVVITENAPALYTTRGQGVADQLTTIAQERGYSVTFYKTSSILHGIPQERTRTFFLAWQSATAPIMDWFAKPHATLEEYLLEVPKDALQMNESFNPKLMHDCGYYAFLSHLGYDVRKEAAEIPVRSAFAFVYKKGLLDDAIAWFTENRQELFLKRALHAKKKFGDDMSIWDASVGLSSGSMNAFVGRTALNTIHPFEDRALTLREGMHMMAMPHDFELLGGEKNKNMISQNVPVCTAADIVFQAVKFLDGKLKDSGNAVMRQNNIKQTIDTPIAGAKFDQI